MNDYKQSVLVEIYLPGNGGKESILRLFQELAVDGFQLDRSYEPVFMNSGTQTDYAATVIVRGWVNSESVIKELNTLEVVANVWKDTRIAPMSPPD